MIVFLDWSQYRAWPMYVGSVVAILITVVAFKRGKDEGVDDAEDASEHQRR